MHIKLRYLLGFVVLLLASSITIAEQELRSPLLDYNFHKNLSWNIGSAYTHKNENYFNQPVSFLQKPNQVSIRYSANNLIDRDAKNFNSSLGELTGIYQFDKLIPLNTVAAFSVSQISDKLEIRESQNEAYLIEQNRDSYNLALSTEVSNFLSVGLGSTLQQKKPLTSYEIKLQTTPYFTTWYRAFTQQERYLFSYQLSDNISSLYYQPFKKVNELEFQARIPGIARARYVFNPQKSKNKGLMIRSEYFQKLILSFAQSQLYSAGESILFFDNRPGNEIEHSSEYRSDKYAIQYFLSNKATLSFAFEKKQWVANMQGEIDSNIIPFLTSLFAIDDRSFNANLAWQEKNYLVEYQFQMSKRYSIKTSFEWINLRPSADLAHWISPPFFNIIKLDKETSELTIQQLDILRINIEASIVYKSIIASFTLGQLAPIRLKYSESEKRDNYTVGVTDIKSISSRLKKGIEGYKLGFQVDYLF